jgi:lipoprotein-releasing system permease protein
MYLFALAFRYLVRRKIAYISIVAIAFGLMAMIVVSSVMEGFQRKIRDSIHSMDGALTIFVDNATVRSQANHYDIVRRRLAPYLAENGGPIVATSRRVQQIAMLNSKAGSIPGGPQRPVRQRATLIGVDPILETDVLPLDKLLRDVKHPDRRVREIDNPEAKHVFDFRPVQGPSPIEDSIILGEELARSLGVYRGDRITVISAVLDQERLEDWESVSRSFIVAGCFRSGRYEYDSELALCEGRVLQSMLQLGNDCSYVVARLDDPELAREVKKKIKEGSKEGNAPLQVFTWEDRMKAYAAALQFEKVAMLVVLSCIIIVAGASICGILYMVVLEKTRDIGILLSMGATSRGIVGVFMLYGGALGLIGSLLGVLLGVEVTLHLQTILETIESVFGIDLFPQNVYEFDTLPTKLQPQVVVMFALSTFLWCLVSSILPALRAARLDPVRCLSYE